MEDGISHGRTRMIEIEICHHRFFVYGQDWEDNTGEPLVDLLRELGLESKHYVLDFGCGSLRVGRWLIPYLDKNQYFGIEPNTWLIEMALKEEIPEDIIKSKAPTFSDKRGHDLSVFRPQKFDFILASGVLIHSSHSQLDPFFESLPESLKKDGTLVGEIRTGGSEYMGEEWNYPKDVNHEHDCIANRVALVGMKLEWLPPQPFYGTWFTVKHHD